MKRMRKVLSFMLILALIMGSFSMAFAAPGDNDITLSDIAGLLGEDQIEVCVNLGIITGMPDGTYQGDKLVNRAEFAAIITRALGIPDSALSGYATTSFNDTAGYGWAIPYLAFLQSKGIMIGDGLGNAMPGRTISVNEAMTMILRAIGYVDNSSELVGKWPSNYVTLGKAQELYKDVSEEVYMDRENAAIAIYNALTVQLVAVNTDGKTDPRWIERPSTIYEEDGIPACLLNTGLDCYAEANVILGGNYGYGDSLINITKNLGAWGTAYLTKDDDLLVAFKPKTTFVTGYMDGDKLVATDGKKYTFDQKNYDKLTDTLGGVFENTEYKSLNLDATVSNSALEIKAIMNAIADGDYDISTTNSVDSKHIIPDGGDLTIAAKVAGTTIKDIRSIVLWQATDADQVGASDVSGIKDDQELFGGEFVLDDDQGIDVKQFKLDGVASLDDIAVDDVVYVYANTDKEIRKVAVGQEVIEGVIDELDDDEMLIDGKAYSYAHDYLEYNDNATPYTDFESDAGADAVVNLDAYGYAFKVDTTGGDLGTFGVIVKASGTTGMTNQVRVYTSDDSDPTFDLVKAKNFDLYNNNVTKSKIQNITSEGALMTTIAGMVGDLVGYKLNSGGNLTTLEPAREVTGDKLTIRSKTLLSDDGKTYSIAKDAAVFTYDGDKGAYGTRGDYEVSSLSDIDFTDAKNINGQYVLNKKGDKVTAILIGSAYADAAKDDVYGVVNTVKGIKSGDDNASRLTGFIDGAAFTLDTTDYTFDEALNVPVLFKLTKNASGKIKTPTPIGDSYKTGDEIRLLTDDAGFYASDARSPGSSSDAKIALAAGQGLDAVALDDDVVVYKAVWNSPRYEYSKSSVGNIKAESLIWAYDTKKKDDLNELATVIIWVDQAGGDLRPGTAPAKPTAPVDPAAGAKVELAKLTKIAIETVGVEVTSTNKSETDAIDALVAVAEGLIDDTNYTVSFTANASSYTAPVDSSTTGQIAGTFTVTSKGADSATNKATGTSVTIVINQEV